MMFSETPIVVQVRSPSRGVDEDPGHRPGALGRVEHPDPVVDQVDPGQGRVVRRRWPAARPRRGR